VRASQTGGAARPNQQDAACIRGQEPILHLLVQTRRDKPGVVFSSSFRHSESVTNMILIAWEFQVREDRVHEFERHYGPQGTWARLFERSPEFRGTRLFRDPEAESRYLTIDCWTSDEAFAGFKKKFAREYQELDRACEALTVKERRFDRVSGQSA
jgi:heme-degrading monooxygenase HmoA